MKLKLSCAVLFLFAVVFSSLSAYAAVGAVYTETNSSNQNAILIFNRSEDGQLFSASLAAVSTGGSGTGTGLGSQGALAIDPRNTFLFAVNAGSNNISTFRITNQGLSLIGLTSSNGSNPISLTVNHNVLYVLNDGGAVGGTDTIAGFSVNDSGHLTPIVRGLQLSAASVAPEEISFNPDGDLLVVTEKATNNIDVFTVDNNGVASGPTIVPSAAQSPYGFAFGKRNQLIVSDAVGGSGGAGAVSSYAASADGMLQSITGSAADGQTAPCWIVLTSDGQYAYTTNTGSGSVSSYEIAFDGTLGLLNPVAANIGSGSSPVDEAISNDSRYLYVLAPGSGNIQAFTVALDGSLVPLSQTPVRLSSASGLVAR
jgi:6-phosphogluconolactonase (cycloisomerase 2 family)